jgi:hypothetical protein
MIQMSSINDGENVGPGIFLTGLLSRLMPITPPQLVYQCTAISGSWLHKIMRQPPSPARATSLAVTGAVHGLPSSTR